MNVVHWLKATLWRRAGLVWSSQSGWMWLDNSGWKSQRWWPTKLLTRCGEQCEFNWPRPWAVSGGQWVTSDNRERAGWLVNRGHRGLGGGPKGSGARCGCCTVHWCRGMLDRISVFLFLVLQGMLPTTKAGLGVHREVSSSVQSWRPLQRPAGGGGPGAFTYLLWWEPVYRGQNPKYDKRKSD